MKKPARVTIIGHRGARGHAVENTLESLKAALDTGADMVEFDIWTSRDGIPFLLHDADFRRIAGHNGRIFDMDSKDIEKLRTADGQKIITAREAMRFLRKTPVYIEIKDYFLTKGVLEVLNMHSEQRMRVGSYNHGVLLEIKKKRPDIELYAGTIWHPMETLRVIKRNNLCGLSLQYQWFNPLIYFYCRHANIDIMLFTVNHRWLLKHLIRFYPGLSICTDYPDRARKALAEVSGR